jgi:hypothetical protein
VSGDDFDVKVEKQRIAALAPEKRQAYLQRLIGPPTESVLTLDKRAKLMTSLSADRLWPVGVEPIA